MSVTQKEAAELRREKSELEQKRLALKTKAKNHRNATTEELTKSMNCSSTRQKPTKEGDYRK
jgi:hypothetical protein